MEFDAVIAIRFFCIFPGDAGCLHSPYGQKRLFFVTFRLRRMTDSFPEYDVRDMRQYETILTTHEGAYGSASKSEHLVCQEDIIVGQNILIEISARHIHLSDADLETLFGKGYQLTNKKNLSQPGQFACEEKVTVIGAKGEQKMSVLGPTRKATQVELSLTDARALGLRLLSENLEISKELQDVN